MRVIYLDPGLRDERGHWANSCRTITGELARQGVDTAVFGHRDIIPKLQQELQAVPLFRVFTADRTDGDPISGALNWFDKAARATFDDLGRLDGITVDDVIDLNSAEPAQLMSLIRWSQSFPADRRPHMALEFGSEPGVDVTFTDEPDGLKLYVRDYRSDARAMLYRFAACQLRTPDLARFHMTTFDTATSTVYARLLNKPVGLLPLPQVAPSAVASRVGRHPVTVAVLGHQRPDKGYHLVPAIARTLLACEPDINMLIHNCVPEQLPAVQQDLQALAAVEPRVSLNEQPAGPELWGELFARSDLILCPYKPERYTASYSAVATEAVANAIPLVVPAKTSLSRLLAAFGDCGTSFEGFETDNIVAATRQAVARFDTIAQRAADAAQTWEATMGVRNMIAALLRLCQAA